MRISDWISDVYSSDLLLLMMIQMKYKGVFLANFTTKKINYFIIHNKKGVKLQKQKFMIEKTLQILQIDNIDLQILSILMNDATTPYTEIAKELVVSSGTVHVRMKKLHELGIVVGSNLLINPQKKIG